MTGLLTPRAGLGLAGVALTAFGAWHLLAEGWHAVGWTAIWLAGAVAVHDGLVVPLTLGVAWLGHRLLPAAARRTVALALVVLLGVTATAVPVLGRWGARADNPTLLDRDYVAGWFGFAALVLVGTLLWIGFSTGPRGGRGR